MEVKSDRILNRLISRKVFEKYWVLHFQEGTIGKGGKWPSMLLTNDLFDFISSIKVNSDIESKMSFEGNKILVIF